MLNLLSAILRRCSRATLSLLAALALVACSDLAAALPPRPSPFPTLARLPSVTPVTPSPTLWPSATPVAVATPTPTLPVAMVAVDANMRSGPGLDFAIVTVVSAGSSIALSGRRGDWYEVRTADGFEGWMSNQVLEIEPSVAEQLPLTQP